MPRQHCTRKIPCEQHWTKSQDCTKLNYLVSLTRNEKKSFYNNLDTKVATDNRVIWKTVKPFLYEKVTKHSKINLFQEDKIISREDQTVKKFSEHVINIPSLNMPSNGYKCPDSSERDSILKILNKYRDHTIIKLIKAKNNSQVFNSVKLTMKKSKDLSKVLTRKKKKEKCRHFCIVHMWRHQWFNLFFKISQQTETSAHCNCA